MPVRLTGDHPRQCPFPCGLCCKTLWHTVPELQIEFHDRLHEAHCPHLSAEPPWCTRAVVPQACQRYLCDLAEGYINGKWTKLQMLELLRRRREQEQL